MNREQLKSLINEAIKEVLNEKTPPGFDPELKKQILKQYPGEPDKAYATMQKIHKDTVGKKKKKSVKEQEGEDEPTTDVDAEAEPQSEQPSEHEVLLSKVDNIIQSLNDLKSSLQTHSGVESPEGEEGTEEIGRAHV